MIHPLFTQYNEDLGNHLNSGRPADDFARYGETVIKAVAGVVRANGTAADPQAYAEKVGASVFPYYPPLYGRRRGRVRPRRVERSFPDR